MNQYMNIIIKLLEELTTEIKELNLHNRNSTATNYIEKSESDMDTKPRGNKGFNNDSLRGK